MHTAQAEEANPLLTCPERDGTAWVSFPVIYFIHGPDRLLAREAARVVAQAADPDNANTTWLDGREIPLDRIIAAIGTVSFFGGSRVVVVTGLLDRAERDAEPSGANIADDGSRGRNTATLAALVGAVPDEHCLILLESGLSSPPAALKTVAPDAKVISGEPPRGAALVTWIAETASNAGARFSRQAAQFLAETLFPQTWDRAPSNPRYDRPPDMALLTQEIEKLALAAYPEEIGREHISALIPGGPDQRVFRFLDAALSGDLRTTTTELDRLAAAGDELAMVLAQLLGQIELTAVAIAAGDRDASAIARDLGSISASRMSAILSSSRRQPSRDGAAVNAGVASDRALKTGRMRRPEDALQDLIAALANTSAQRNTDRSR